MYCRGYCENDASLTGLVGSFMSGNRLVPSVHSATLNEACPGGQAGRVTPAAASVRVGNLGRH